MEERLGVSPKGRKRMEKFAVGMLVGVVCGAFLVANNYKMRTLVKKSSDEIAEKFDNMMDEKIDELEQKAQNFKEDVQDKAEETRDKMKRKVSLKK